MTSIFSAPDMCDCGKEPIHIHPDGERRDRCSYCIDAENIGESLRNNPGFMVRFEALTLDEASEILERLSDSDKLRVRVVTRF